MAGYLSASYVDSDVGSNEGGSVAPKPFDRRDAWCTGEESSFAADIEEGVIEFAIISDAGGRPT